MEKQQYLIDFGLLGKLKGFVHFTTPESFETIANIFKTIQEYREYSHPGTPAWQEYILNFFHLLGFQTRTISPNNFGLSEIGTTDSIFPISVAIQSLEGNEAVRSFDHCSSEWGVLTDGLQIKLYYLRQDDYNPIYYYANLEKILADNQLDRFCTLYKLFAFIRKSSEGSFEDASNKISTAGINEDPIFIGYAQQFAMLKTNVNYTQWTSATKYCAPHKPFLLLATLDLFSLSQFPTGLIEITPELINRYQHYWSIILHPGKRQGQFVYPFFHLRSCAFWHLVPVPGKEQELLDTQEISAISRLKKLVVGARLDGELVKMIKNNNHLQGLREILIATYFDQNHGEKIRNFSKQF